MFSSPASVVGEPSGYDFQKEENAAKWKGVFVNSLRKVFIFEYPSTDFYCGSTTFCSNVGHLSIPLILLSIVARYACTTDFMLFQVL